MRRVVAQLNPDAVIHCAALSRPDLCEKNPNDSWVMNYLATRNIALACDRFDTELLHLSTDQVFYGADSNRAHDEYDALESGNVYGKTKIAAERYIKDHLRRYYIIRTGKIFGGPNDSKSFMHHAWENFSSGKEMACATDWAAHATHAEHLSRSLIAILERKTYGIYHVASPEAPNYLTIAHQILGAMGRPRTLAVPSTRRDVGLAAGRPPRCELSLKCWLWDFKNHLPPWQEGIKLFVRQRQEIKVPGHE